MLNQNKMSYQLAKLLATHPSHPNNPDIANAFFRAGMIESWGRGIEKIIHQCLIAGLPAPVFDTTFGGLQIEFYPINKTVEETVEETILRMIKTNPKTTANDILATTGLSRRGVEYNLNQLKTIGRIRRFGSTKSGTWQIVE